jgi:hypothetical protein
VDHWWPLERPKREAKKLFPTGKPVCCDFPQGHRPSSYACRNAHLSSILFCKVTRLISQVHLSQTALGPKPELMNRDESTAPPPECATLCRPTEGTSVALAMRAVPASTTTSVESGTREDGWKGPYSDDCRHSFVTRCSSATLCCSRVAQSVSGAPSSKRCGAQPATFAKGTNVSVIETGRCVGRTFTRASAQRSSRAASTAVRSASSISSRAMDFVSSSHAKTPPSKRSNPRACTRASLSRIDPYEMIRRKSAVPSEQQWCSCAWQARHASAF